MPTFQFGFLTDSLLRQAGKAGLSFSLAAAVVAHGQQPAAATDSKPTEGARALQERPAPEPGFAVVAGTRVPLVMINSVSTKHAAAGDRLYLETSFPVVVNGKIVIPAGSYVAGTITESKRAGRIKGKAELFLRFDSLTLPNGVTRDFRARAGGLDGRSSEKLDKEEGKIVGDSSKGSDATTIATTASTGASVGSIAGAASGNTMRGLGIGTAAGAAAGGLMVLLTRGQDVVLARGTVVEMVLDRDIAFSDQELDFSGPSVRSGASNFDGGPAGKTTNRNRLGTGMPGRVF